MTLDVKLFQNFERYLFYGFAASSKKDTQYHDNGSFVAPFCSQYCYGKSVTYV